VFADEVIELLFAASAHGRCWPIASFRRAAEFSRYRGIAESMLFKKFMRPRGFERRHRRMFAMRLHMGTTAPYCDVTGRHSVHALKLA
jgi:hypothetical protein